MTRITNTRALIALLVAMSAMLQLEKEVGRNGPSHPVR